MALPCYSWVQISLISWAEGHEGGNCCADDRKTGKIGASIGYYHLIQPDAAVTLQQPVGVPVIARPLPDLVVPNPASDWVTIRLNEATEEASAISITSINGALEMSAILPGGVTEKQLNISLLPAGIHVVAVRNSQQTYVTRIVKK